MGDGVDPMADAELVLRFQGGDASAFESLVRRHWKDAYAFSYRLTGRAADAEDLSQEGFVTAYRSLREFRGEASFQSWLYRILLNRHRDRVRSRRREEARIETIRCETRSEERAVPAGSEADELAERVRAGIQGLPPRQREVLVLHLHQGLSHGEIAAVLGCSYDDVKMCLSLARRRMRELLKDRP